MAEQPLFDYGSVVVRVKPGSTSPTSTSAPSGVSKGRSSGPTKAAPTAAHVTAAKPAAGETLPQAIARMMSQGWSYDQIYGQIKRWHRNWSADQIKAAIEQALKHKIDQPHNNRIWRDIKKAGSDIENTGKFYGELGRDLTLSLWEDAHLQTHGPAQERLDKELKSILSSPIATYQILRHPLRDPFATALVLWGVKGVAKRVWTARQAQTTAAIQQLILKKTIESRAARLEEEKALAMARVRQIALQTEKNIADDIRQTRRYVRNKIARAAAEEWQRQTRKQQQRVDAPQEAPMRGPQSPEKPISKTPKPAPTKGPQPPTTMVVVEKSGQRTIQLGQNKYVTLHTTVRTSLPPNHPFKSSAFRKYNPTLEFEIETFKNHPDPQMATLHRTVFDITARDADGKFMGNISLRREKGDPNQPRWYVQGPVYVPKELRRQGIGSTLERLAESLVGVGNLVHDTTRTELGEALAQALPLPSHPESVIMRGDVTFKIYEGRTRTEAVKVGEVKGLGASMPVREHITMDRFDVEVAVKGQQPKVFSLVVAQAHIKTVGSQSVIEVKPVEIAWIPGRISDLNVKPSFPDVRH